MDKNIEQAVDQAVQEAVNQQLLIQGGITTIFIIAGILVARYFLSRFIKGKSEILEKGQRRWLNNINNATVLVILVALVFIWAPQIHTFALSLTAFAVAVVLTTKELLMCLTGGFLRATTKPFDIGDWITVDGMTGEVMRITGLATTLEEIDTAHGGYRFTGRTIHIPNSRYLSVNAENANFIRSYVYQTVPITVQYGDLDPEKLMTELQKITETYFAPYREDALKFNKKVERKVAVDFDDPDPQFFLRTKEDGHNIFTVRMFVPTMQAADISTNITRDFLKFVYDLKNRREKSKKKSA